MLSQQVLCPAPDTRLTSSSHANCLLRKVNGWLNHLLWLKKPQVNSIQHSWDKEKDIHLPSIHFGLLIDQLSPKPFLCCQWNVVGFPRGTLDLSVQLQLQHAASRSLSLFTDQGGNDTISSLRCLQQAFLKTITMKNLSPLCRSMSTLLLMNSLPLPSKVLLAPFLLVPTVFNWGSLFLIKFW